MSLRPQNFYFILQTLLQKFYLDITWQVATNLQSKMFSHPPLEPLQIVKPLDNKIILAKSSVGHNRSAQKNIKKQN